VKDARIAVGLLLGIVMGVGAVAASGTVTGPGSSERPCLVCSKPGVLTESILTTGGSVGG
jgi:hypothetical protein